MHNIEYLTERDLKYFEKKEALGEAIIIRIEPAVLLSLDLDALFQEPEKDQTLSVEELEAFLHGRNKGAAKQELPADADKHPENSIEENLKNIQLSLEKQQELMKRIQDGASDYDLMNLLQSNGYNSDEI